MITLLILFILAGCGASDTATFTMPDGTVKTTSISKWNDEVDKAEGKDNPNAFQNNYDPLNYVGTVVEVEGEIESVEEGKQYYYSFIRDKNDNVKSDWTSHIILPNAMITLNNGWKIYILNINIFEKNNGYSISSLNKGDKVKVKSHLIYASAGTLGTIPHSIDVFPIEDTTIISVIN